MSKIGVWNLSFFEFPFIYIVKGTRMCAMPCGFDFNMAASMNQMVLLMFLQKKKKITSLNENKGSLSNTNE